MKFLRIINRQIRKNPTKVSQSGIGLVETMIAIGIAIIVITSLVSLSLFTLRSSLQSKLNLQGTKIANQQLELVRAFRDTQGWDQFISTMQVRNCSSSNCNINTSLSVSSGTGKINPGTAEEIEYYFRMTDPEDGFVAWNEKLLRVSVTVHWTVGSDDKYTYNYTDVSDWR